MKIDFSRISGPMSGRVSGCGILLFLLTFSVPGSGKEQDMARGASLNVPRPNPAPLPDIPKETPEKASAEALKSGSITDVTIAPQDGKLTVTIVTDRLLAPYEFMVENPPRLVMDFPNTENKVPFTRRPVNAASVKRLRVQQFQGLPNMITRIVFDLTEDFVAHEVTLDKACVRVVFDPKAPKRGADKASRIEDPTKARDYSAMPLPVPFRSETPKVVSAAGNREPPPAKEPVKVTGSPASTLPPPVPYKSELSRTVPSAEAAKPGPAEERAEAAAPSTPIHQVQPIQVLPRADLAKVTVPMQPMDAQASPPLVAALAASSIPAPPKAFSFPDSRYSGQPLTLDLVDINLVDFFRLMAEEGGINIVMDPGIKGTISIKVVKVPWDQIFEAALANNGLDKQVEGSLVRIARKSTLQEEAKQRESLKKANLLAADLETRIKRLNYAKAEYFVDALADQKTVRGTVVVDERTNSLILTDIPSSIDRLIHLIESLDIPQPQVEIEARIVSATRDFARDIGIQFGFVQGNLQRVTIGGPNTFGTIGGTRPSATPTSTYAAGNSSTGRGAAESDTTQSAGVSTGTSTQNKGNFNVNLPATKAFGGLGISIGNIFDTFLLDAAITAGETKGLAKLISQPKVTAQNNSQALITQGLRFPVQIVANNTVTVQFQNAALTLTVTPQITYEGNIVLDLKVENNTPDFSNQVNNIPSIRTSESTTRVLVSDGGTTVIGGILMDDEANHEDKIPGLGSLPVVGNLFRRTSVARNTTEVLFFVTPRIVK